MNYLKEALMSNPTLVAQTRSEFGKGAARRARRAGLVPGVLYGHGDAPLHVDLPGHELFLAVRGQKNALVELVIEGKKHLALVKEVQRHPVSRNLLHADFLAVKAGELVDVDGFTGGYNLQAAFSMGAAAGRWSAARAGEAEI